MKNISELNLARNTEEQRMAQDNCIFLCRVGSQMYGTNTSESDDDIIGIFVEDTEYIIGRKKCEQIEFLTNSTSSGKRNKAGDKDYKFYSLTKWFQMAINNNPNVLELFFSPANCILYESDEWKRIRDNKNLFISLKSFHSFSGYAHSQGLRLEVKSGNNTGRKELQEKYGYDTKLFSHMLRLYYECRQLLKEEQITMPLPDRVEILQYKRGEYPGEEGLKKGKERVMELGKQCEQLYTTSKLRYAPDFENISKLQMDILLSYWNKTGQLDNIKGLNKK
jgi:predicted nucleotidyltransferase